MLNPLLKAAKSFIQPFVIYPNVSFFMALVLTFTLTGCCTKNIHKTVVKIHIPADMPNIYTIVCFNKPSNVNSKVIQLKSSRGTAIIGQRLKTPDKDMIAIRVNPADIGSGMFDFTICEDEHIVSPFIFSERGESFLDLTENGDPVLSYIFGMHLIDGIPDDRRRSNYIHPIYGLDGEIVTDDFPVDHHHHRGLYFAWPTVVVDGDSLDLWHIMGIEKRFEEWLTRETGPVFARFGLKNGWYSSKRKVVQETMYTTVYRAGDIGRIIDVELILEAIKSDVFLSGSRDPKGYGGCNFRPAPFSNETITTELGQQGDSDLRRFLWADFSAVFHGSDIQSGVSVFPNPANLNTPNGWCLRHYGFLGVSWPGKNTYFLRVDRPLVLHYRIWIHRGNAQDGKSAEAYILYANPFITITE